MLQDIDNVKKILAKSFCFMQWQEDDAKKVGRETMDEEDIRYLLCSPGLTKEELLHCYEETNESISKLQLLKIIQKAKNEKKNGIILGTTLGDQNHNAVIKRGYFVNQTGHGSVLWDEIYLSEDAFLRSEISHFQNLFGSFASVAPMI